LLITWREQLENQSSQDEGASLSLAQLLYIEEASSFQAEERSERNLTLKLTCAARIPRLIVIPVQ
jgi:hypothetical protein